jgi:outer membrane murein-binding lipoprotein Lpp
VGKLLAIVIACCLIAGCSQRDQFIPIAETPVCNAKVRY